MTHLSEEIRELSAKANAAFSDAMASVDRGDPQDQIDEYRGYSEKRHDRLAIILMQNRNTILAALELSERLVAPDYVEVVRDAIISAKTRNGTFSDFVHDDEAIFAARAAIAAMKG